MKLVKRFLDYITYEKRYSAHTIKAYRADISSFFNFLGEESDERCRNVASPDIRSWVLHLASKQITARSYKRKLSSLKAFYNFLIREGEIKGSPTDGIIIPKIQNPIPDFFKSKETENLFDFVNFTDDFQGHRDKLILYTFYYTGIRLSELVNLKIQDVDFRLQQISVLGKRNKQRNIPVTSFYLEQVSDYLIYRNKEFGDQNSNKLFLSNKGNDAYSRFVQRIVKKYMAQATTSEKVHPHKLRHTFATHMLNNGADLNAVKELLGHSSLAATEVYTHNTYEKLKSIYKQAHPRA